MREIIKNLLRVYYRHKQVKLWNREVQSESERILPDNTIKQQIAGRCLVLVPHSDDEWVGCSRLVKEGQDIVLCNMDMNGGDTPSMHEKRFEEMVSLAKDYNRRIISIKENKSKELKNIIDEVKPDYVFLPHYIDWHPEHIEVMKTLYDSAKEGANDFHVMMYQVSCPIITGITHALPMTKEQWNEKWDYFKSHYRTQTTIPYQRFSMNEVINGRHIGANAAEVFCEVVIEDWLKLIENKIPTEEQISGLKGNLGSITMMRQYIKTNLLKNEKFVR